MECSVNHANLGVGRFCPACGTQVTAQMVESTAPTPSWAVPSSPENLTSSTSEYGGYEERNTNVPKLIGLISLGVATVLVITGIFANKSGWDNLINSINSTADNSSLSSSIFGSDSGSGSSSSGDSSGSSSGDTSWPPSGYTVWSGDTSIAYTFDSTDQCQTDDGNGCWLVRVTSSGTCNSVSGSMDLKDSSGSFVNTADASGGSISAGNSDLLEFDDPDGSASTSNLTSLTCG